MQKQIHILLFMLLATAIQRNQAMQERLELAYKTIEIKTKELFDINLETTGQVLPGGRQCSPVLLLIQKQTEQDDETIALLSSLMKIDFDTLRKNPSLSTKDNHEIGQMVNRGADKIKAIDTIPVLWPVTAEEVSNNIKGDPS